MANSDRKPYLTATVLDQDLLDNAQDNLVNDFEMIVDIETPTAEVLHLSDRNKYVGSGDPGDAGVFYEARVRFPIIKKTIGEFLSPAIKFSTLSLEINNADGKFNRLLPAGDDYDGWIGRKVTVSLGLRNLKSSYFKIFEGSVSPKGGFERTVKSFTLVARNKFEEINKSFPREVFKIANTPDIEPNYDNTIIPYVYGDWTVVVEPGGASLKAIPVNGNSVNVNGGDDVTPGDHTVNVSVVISDNANTFFDSTEVYIKRGDFFFKFDPADIVNVSVNKNSFQVRQAGTAPAGVTMVDGALYEFTKGDIFLVKAKGKDLGAAGVNDNNIVEQARDILLTFGGASALDFTSNWDTVRDKNTPAFPVQDAVKQVLSRIWAQEPQNSLDFALSLLEQVRVEPFINRDQKIDLSTLHFSDFVNPSSTPTLKNWDIVRPTLQPKIDDRTNLNRAKAVFNFLPNRNEEFNETKIFKNTAAITQSGVEESKKIVFPNLYAIGDAERQLIETIRLASSTPENIYLSATWRSMLRDIGDFILLDVDIEGVIFANVPCLVREIGYDPNGIKLPMRLWSFQMTPFPGYTPGYPGTIGGYNQTITEE